MSRSALAQIQRRGMVPDSDYLMNHVVNRIPLTGPRMRAYAALGVSLDDADSSIIALGVEVWNGRGLSLGSRSAIGQRCYIDARGGIRIDSDVSISREVCILTATHEVDSPDFSAALTPVHLGRSCWVATRATILPGVKIGDGAVVGAGALVTRDVAPYTVVGGVPAKVLAARSEPMSYSLDWRPNWH
jgi:acetyltransferase-like isoleucine patch superfamily enzyme